MQDGEAQATHMHARTHRDSSQCPKHYEELMEVLRVGVRLIQPPHTTPLVLEVEPGDEPREEPLPDTHRGATVWHAIRACAPVCVCG